MYTSSFSTRYADAIFEISKTSMSVNLSPQASMSNEESIYLRILTELLHLLDLTRGDPYGHKKRCGGV
jgi:hypothetical protein